PNFPYRSIDLFFRYMKDRKTLPLFDTNRSSKLVHIKLDKPFIHGHLQYYRSSKIATPFLAKLKNSVPFLETHFVTQKVNCSLGLVAEVNRCHQTFFPPGRMTGFFHILI